MQADYTKAGRPGEVACYLNTLPFVVKKQKPDGGFDLPALQGLKLNSIGTHRKGVFQ